MSNMLNDDDGVAHAEPGFLPEHSDALADHWSEFCCRCGACVADCPAARYGGDFDPRQIMLEVRFGLGDKLLVEHSVIWQCFRCNNCYERCPQPMKPVEVITQLRGMAENLLWSDRSSNP